MPRENRKRGKKHKKPKDVVEDASVQHYHEDQQAGPSWIIDPKPGHEFGEDASPDAPFGYVDPDVKAYFRTVDAKLREWQETDSVPDMEQGAELNEERRMFLVAALTELSGKEKQLATDPDCSNILERMAYSMDDFVKRVIFDRLAGSYEQLARHRFGSHVVQTLLSVAKGTISRESEGQIMSAPDSGESTGVLESLTQLVLDLVNELLPIAPSLIMDPFASHVLRSLLVLLCPTLNPTDESSNSLLRSKKSAKHRARQGPMKSVFVGEVEEAQEKGKGKIESPEAYPPKFDEVARKFVASIRREMDANEIRALAANKVACPLLVLLLELEAIQDDSNEPGSLMDSVSAGLITSCLDATDKKPESSDFVATLLRDPASSRLLETLVSLSPAPVFDLLWELYFKGKLAKLAVHPVANFVVARAVARLNEEQMTAVLGELEGTCSKFIKNARLGVLKALVDRSAELGVVCKDVINAVLDAFGLKIENAKDMMIMCILQLKIVADYLEISNKASGEEGSSKEPFEPSIQGSLLIQSLLRLPEAQNQLVTDSIASLSIDKLLALSHHPISSRVIDVFLESPTVPARTRRRLILAFQGHFHTLVDDRVGSRVGERLWNAADPYLKEKIARTLLPHETALVGSRYGKYFVRGLNLYLLKRDPEEWKTAQVKAGRKEVPTPKPTSTAVSKPLEPAAKEERSKSREKKRKRAEKGENEIDAVFNSTLGKKQKKVSLSVLTLEEDLVEKKVKSKYNDASDKDLAAVLNAIHGAPKDIKGGTTKKKKPVTV